MNLSIAEIAAIHAVMLASPNPKWKWVRVHGTRFYRVWRHWPHCIEQHAAVVDDFGNLIFIEQGPFIPN